jgi:hypothetical protein
VLVALAGCGRSPVTATRLEASIAPTFANLVHVQLERAGLPAIPATDITVTARCTRVGGGSSGAGEWVCSIVWSGPNGRLLRDTYDVSVGVDGCYTASVDAAETELGGPIIKGPDGREVRNLLYRFDGCFDTT